MGALSNWRYTNIFFAALLEREQRKLEIQAAEILAEMSNHLSYREAIFFMCPIHARETPPWRILVYLPLPGERTINVI
jgi:hypothetical protein